MKRKPEVENTKSVKKSAQVLYTKTGGGFFYLGERIIKPGERFYAHPDEIPSAFLDTVEVVKEEGFENVIEPDEPEVKEEPS